MKTSDKKKIERKLNAGSLIQSYRRLSHYVLAHRRSLTLVALCMVAAAILEIMRPWPIKIVFDVILVPQENPGAVADYLRSMFGTEDLLLALCAISIFFIAVFGGFISFAETSLLASTGQKVVAAIRLDLYRHIQRLSQSFHDTARSGDLLARLTGDVRMLRDLLINSVMFISARALIFTGMLIVMLAMDWQLTLVALSVIPLLAFSSGYFVKRIKSAAREQRRNESRIAHVVTENLSSIKVVQAFARESFEGERFSERNNSSATAEISAIRQATFFDRLVKVFVAAGTCGVIWFGVMRVQAGVLTPGDLLVFTTYLAALYKPVKKIAELTSRLTKAGVRAERIIEILDCVPEVRERPNAKTAGPFKGDIQVCGVTFDYGREGDILNNASLKIAAGETIAIMSKSGAGKSTIAHLLLRFYDPISGSIKIDGRDIKNYSLASLREQITVLLQDTALFNASIRENIGYGKLDATDEQVEAAAKAANAHEFIMALPEGYDTVIGPRGGTISGGQRQRIALARAILKDAPILVLDEATSALDTETEREIQGELKHLATGRTTLTVAHRLATVKKADGILVFDGARIVATGDHDTLVAQDGLYARLARLQFTEGMAAE